MVVAMCSRSVHLGSAAPPSAIRLNQRSGTRTLLGWAALLLENPRHSEIGEEQDKEQHEYRRGER
jgi:hypothetical protein